MNLALSCKNTSKADHFAAFIDEDEILGGPVGGIQSLWMQRLHTIERTTTLYNVIHNFGNGNASVPVISVIRPLEPGNITCELNIGDPENFKAVQLNFVTDIPTKEVSFTIQQIQSTLLYYSGHI